MAKAEKEEKVDLHPHHLLVNAKTIKVKLMEGEGILVMDQLIRLEIFQMVVWLGLTFLVPGW